MQARCDVFSTAMSRNADPKEKDRTDASFGRRSPHKRRSTHFLFPIIVWIESGWVFFGTLALISATFYVLGNMQEFTGQSLELLVSVARIAGLFSTVFTAGYIILTAFFRAGGGPRRLAHMILATLVLILSLIVTLGGFAVESLVAPLV